MPTYTFRCPDCGNRWDQRVAFDTENHPCPNCPWLGYRESVYRVNSVGWASTPGTERDYSRDWKNAQEAGAELEYQHERLMDATQVAGLKPPPLYQMAKAKARDLKAKGATADNL